MRPVVHLTNFASKRLHTGRVWSIMARPRAWEHGQGKVPVLIPDRDDLSAVRHGTISWEEYQRRFEAALRPHAAELGPGVLGGLLRDRSPALVASGDTLCCGCARGKPCHRLWAAAFLRDAGWDVILDGELLGGPR
jgi:hypothetical protein